MAKFMGKKQRVEVPPMEVGVMQVRIVGDTELVIKRLSEKPKEAIRGADAKEVKKPKAKRDPKAEYLAAFHRLPNGRPAIKAGAFKKSCVNARQHVAKISKSIVSGGFHVLGDLVEIVSDKPYMREDWCRNMFGGAILVYRPGFRNWSVTLKIAYNNKVVTPEQIVNILNHAGFAVGVGEWRPEKGGTMGMFHVAGLKGK
jgi:hypothetical protein